MLQVVFVMRLCCLVCNSRVLLCVLGVRSSTSLLLPRFHVELCSSSVKGFDLLVKCMCCMRACMLIFVSNHFVPFQPSRRVY